jgi:glutaredoxin-like protein
MKNSEGTKVPQVTFKTRTANAWQDITSSQLFDNKNVIVFALPGAFTPTCSTTHLPRYDELAPVFKANGIDDIICISVNDAFVMNAWSANQHAKHITFIPDGNGEFSKAMDMLVEKNDLGFGNRSWRYSMLVKNGVIDKMFIEPEKPGDPFEVSDADTMLKYINPSTKAPLRISLFTKAGCSHCTRAKDALNECSLSYEEVKLGTDGMSLCTLQAVTGKTTTPQVYVEGKHIGGADELVAWLKTQ